MSVVIDDIFTPNPPDKRDGPQNPLQGILQQPHNLAEKIVGVANDHPYTVIGLMITVAAIIVTAIVTLSVVMVGSVMSLNGTMHEMKVQQEQAISEAKQTRFELAEVRSTITNDGRIMRTYGGTVLSRQELMIGMMTHAQQKTIRDFDKSHPIELPGAASEQRNNQ